jgi:prolyl-tRNA synthetase
MTFEKKIVSEVGNIFKLGSRFSDAFGLKYQDKDGSTGKIVMGCYGIGVSRLVGVIAEKFADDR